MLHATAKRGVMIAVKRSDFKLATYSINSMLSLMDSSSFSLKKKKKINKDEHQQVTLNIHVIIWAVLIHSDLADESSLASLMSLISKNFTSALVYCSIIASSCRSTVKSSVLKLVFQ